MRRPKQNVVEALQRSVRFTAGLREAGQYIMRLGQYGIEHNRLQAKVVGRRAGVLSFERFADQRKWGKLVGTQASARGKEGKHILDQSKAIVSGTKM